jgi:hypothetical protein
LMDIECPDHDELPDNPGCQIMCKGRGCPNAQGVCKALVAPLSPNYDNVPISCHAVSLNKGKEKSPPVFLRARVLFSCALMHRVLADRPQALRGEHSKPNYLDLKTQRRTQECFVRGLLSGRCHGMP